MSRSRRGRPEAAGPEPMRVGRISWKSRGRAGTGSVRCGTRDREQVGVELGAGRAGRQPRSKRRCSGASSAPPTAAAMSSGSWLAWVAGIPVISRPRRVVSGCGSGPRPRAVRRPPSVAGNRAVGRASPAARSASARDRRSATSSAQSRHATTWAAAASSSVPPARRRRRRRSPRGRGRRAGQPRNSSIRSSSRPRRASRPRWMRDLTVPSETPVMSAISA